jgi:hypothetical protein
VGDKPDVPYWNANRLEQRLLREDVTYVLLLLTLSFTLFTSLSVSGPCNLIFTLLSSSGKLWFGSDGRMDNEPDPLKVVSERLTRWYDPFGGFLRTHFVAPTSLPTQQMHLPVGDQFFQLELDITGNFSIIPDREC